MTETDYEIDESFVREARIGLGVVATLLGVFICLAYLKYSGWNRPQPIAFASPVAAEPVTSTESGQRDSLAVGEASTSSWSAERNPQPAVSPPPVAGIDRPAANAASSVAADLRPGPVHGTLVAPDHLVSTLPATQPPPLATCLPTQLESLTPESPQPPRIDTVSAGRDRLFARQASSAVPPGVRNASRTLSGGSFNGSPVTNGPRRSFWANVTRLPRLVVPGAAKRSAATGNAQRALPQHVPPAPVNVNGLRQQQPEPLRLAERLETIVAESSGEIQRASTVQPTKRPVGSAVPEPERSPLSQRPTSVLSQELDSFWLIAQRVYGDGRYFNALYEYNRRHVPSFNEIPTGTRISTPPVEQLHQRWPRLCPQDAVIADQPAASTAAPVHVTEQGETLFGIARDQLGQASRYLEILELNRDHLSADTGHGTELPAGVKIKLPNQ